MVGGGGEGASPCSPTCRPVLRRCRGLRTRGVFLAPGDPADVIELRECLDTGEAFPPSVDMLSVAQVLLDLLESLREPVIPTSLFPPPTFKPSQAEEWLPGVLRQLSPLHYNVLVYLVRFGREALSHAADNGLNVEDLAYVLSRCCMRRIPHEEAPAHTDLGTSDTGPGGHGGPGGVAAGGGGGGGGGAGRAATGGEDDEGPGSALTKLSLYADKGTRWEPTAEEQANMTRIFALLLTTAALVPPGT